MNQNFANHSTGRFAFSVSQAQLRVLFALHQGFTMTWDSHFMVSRQSLISKGMIDARPYSQLGRQRGIKTPYIRDIPDCYEYEISQAGKLIVELAMEAGINYQFKAEKSESTLGLEHMKVGVLS